MIIQPSRGTRRAHSHVRKQNPRNSQVSGAGIATASMLLDQESPRKVRALDKDPPYPIRPLLGDSSGKKATPTTVN